MTEQPIDDSTGPGQEKLEDPLARERLEQDPETEPSAPNREPVTEPVRHDLKPEPDRPDDTDRP